MLNAMIVEPQDNVVVAIEPIAKGDTVTYTCNGEEKALTALEDVTIYHKIAACDIPKGEPIQIRRAYRPCRLRYQGRTARPLPQPGKPPGKPGNQGVTEEETT